MTQFLQVGCPSCSPTDSVKALKEQHSNFNCENIISVKERASTLRNGDGAGKTVEENSSVCSLIRMR